MAREDIHDSLDRANRDKKNHNFKELYEEIDNIANNISDKLLTKIVNESKLQWGTPVDLKEDLPSDASIGDTIMVRDDGKVYRFDGDDWVEIQQIDVGPINDLESRITQQLTNIEKLVLNVRMFGAKGDELTNDSPSFQDAIDFVHELGGGKIIVPPGIYRVEEYITMRSDIHLEIQKGAILKKYNNGVMFSFPSNSKGYDGGVKNVIMDGGGMLHGNFEYANGVICHLHHARDLTVRNLTFYECMSSSHVFDLCGCLNVIFDNCNFYGKKYVEEKSYSEAIQIDYSSYPGLTIKNEQERECVDGATTKNVTIKNCGFYPIKNGNDIDYYAPHPFGGHQQYGTVYHENIRFEGNRVVDVLPDLSSSQNTITRGIIHLLMVDGLYIKNNTFKNSTGIRTNIINLPSLTQVRNIEEVNENNPSSVSLSNSELKSHRNVYIENNFFDGFRNSDKVDSPSIRLIGCKKGFGLINNIKISNNVFENFMLLDDLNQDTTVGHDLILVSHVSTVNVNDNDIKLAKRFMTCSDINDFYFVNNKGEMIDYFFVHATEIDNVFLTNNKTYKSRGMFFVEGDLVDIKDNTYNNVNTIPFESQSSVRNRGVQVTAKFVNVSDNTILAESNMRTGIFIEANNTKGYAINNIVDGFVYEINTGSIDDTVYINDDIYDR